MEEMFKDILQQAEGSVVGTTAEILTGQRSEEWFEKRRGKWTGSRFKDLMAKGRGSAMWGEKAKHYIFSRFMERLRGTPDSPIPQTWAMKRGTELEPYSIAAFEREYPLLQIEEADFIPFDGLETAGASPDGIVVEKANGNKVGVFETKSRGEEGTYAHAFEKVHDRHPDFWQIQAEMVATHTNVCFYCHYTDLHEPPFDLQVQLVERSPDHVIMLLEKIKEADAIVNGALEIVGEDWKELNPNKLTARIIEARSFVYSR